MIKKLLFLLVVMVVGLCFLYPAVELTRVIIAWGNDYGIPPNLDLQFEIALIWVGYAVGMILVGVLVWRLVWPRKRH